MILIVSPNLAVDQTVHVDHLVAGQVHRSKSTRREPGGKGVNVARVLTTLEVPCLLTGFVGGSQGQFITQGLKEENISFRPCRIQNENRTCYLLVDDERFQQTVVNEPGPVISAKESASLASVFREQLSCAKWVILSGSLPPGVPDDLYAELIAVAQAAGKRTLLDCSGSGLRPAVQARPFMLKINHAEAESLTEAPVGNVDQAAHAAAGLQSRYAPLVMVTLGAEGAVLASDDDTLLFVPPAIQARNTVGSGDATLAGLVGGLIQGLPIEELGKLATAAGAANALHGGGHCTKGEIEEFRHRVQCRRMNVER
ncbi:MAG TPA: 1-phosphofructokinase family hexose kinase [Terriglobia bacterium]|nr:1-phosphofructokinase family hexose kinase [Terriglobia bacterium]